MGKVILFGEPMALLTADTVGPLEQVSHFARSMSGAEVNVAIGLTRLGQQAEYLTRLGDDPFGHYIKSALTANHIGTAGISFDHEFRTGIQLKSRVEDGSDPQAPYYRKGSAASHITAAEIDNIDLSDVDIVHVTGIPPALSTSARSATYRLVARAKAAGIFVSFDPNLRPALWPSNAEMIHIINDLARQADLFLPGINECAILCGESDPQVAASYYRGRGAGTVVIKLGATGAYYRSEQLEGQLSGFPVEHVVDTVGAGDGFAVGVLSGLLEGLKLEKAVQRGAAIGALQVMSIGDNEGLPNQMQLQAFMGSCLVN